MDYLIDRFDSVISNGFLNRKNNDEIITVSHILPVMLRHNRLDFLIDLHHINICQ